MSTIIKAELVKKLRELTSVSMMECKRALEQTKGDLDAAIELLRKLGEATAIKKQSRVATEGLIVTSLNDTGKELAVLEVNCETDFVAKNKILLDFATTVASKILTSKITDLTALSKELLDPSTTVEQSKLLVVNKLGENIVLRRAKIFTAKDQDILGYYLHGTDPTKIVSGICLNGGNEILAKEIAMHIVAMRPEYITMADIPKERYAQEELIFSESTKRENPHKPQDILQKIITGRVNKFFKETTLLHQPFVKNPDLTIEELLQRHKAKITQTFRLEVGEGLDKNGN